MDTDKTAPTYTLFCQKGFINISADDKADNFCCD